MGSPITNDVLDMIGEMDITLLKKINYKNIVYFIFTSTAFYYIYSII